MLHDKPCIKLCVIVCLLAIGHALLPYAHRLFSCAGSEIKCIHLLGITLYHTIFYKCNVPHYISYMHHRINYTEEFTFSDYIQIMYYKTQMIDGLWTNNLMCMLSLWTPSHKDLDTAWYGCPFLLHKDLDTSQYRCSFLLSTRTWIHHSMDAHSYSTRTWINLGMDAHSYSIPT